MIKPTILVIIGISGDLSKRKLLPAILSLHRANQLPQQFRIVGTTRQTLNTNDILGYLPADISDVEKTFMHEHTTTLQINTSQVEEYPSLASHLTSIEAEFGTSAQRLFYLSVPPEISSPIVEHLGTSGLAKVENTKLLIEKPFGINFRSAAALVAHINQYFDETQVYRIDHYLAKEMAQNIIIFRGGNSLFKQTWNKNFIENIEIVASESIDIEGRTHFYEQTGAMRDVVQSHLFQLAALTLMELPEYGDWESVPKYRLAALNALNPPEKVLRGQYEGYRDEVANQASMVETFVSMTLYSSDERWSGVPITLTTGKALAEKLTEIRISYRQQDSRESNQLILRIQPQEAIRVCLWVKRPGFERQLGQAQLGFEYQTDNDVIPDAYEHVLLDAINSNHSLFTTSDEVLIWPGCRDCTVR
ncbi:MAG: hypothetical protein ACMG55_10475, partial [Microcoleus sp.]